MAKPSNSIRRVIMGKAIAILLSCLLLLFTVTLAESASYRVVGPIEDFSYLDVKRVRDRIVVPTGLSEQELTDTLKEAVITLAKQQGANAAQILAYREGDDTNWAYTAGTAVYAPGGFWANAAREYPMQVGEIEIAPVYFAKPKADVSKEGDRIILRTKGKELVPISRARDSWAQHNIIAAVPNGTPARVLKHYEKALSPDYTIVRDRVSATYNGNVVEGWVFGDQVKRIKNVSPSRAELIRKVQQLLKSEGFTPGPVDGLFGPRTKVALIAYQLNEMLPVTGMLDERTLRALGLSGN
jgi:hypothetical protein